MAKEIMVVMKETFGWDEVMLCAIQRIIIGKRLTKVGKKSFTIAVKSAKEKEKTMEIGISKLFRVWLF